MRYTIYRLQSLFFFQNHYRSRDQITNVWWRHILFIRLSLAWTGVRDSNKTSIRYRRNWFTAKNFNSSRFQKSVIFQSLRSREACGKFKDFYQQWRRFQFTIQLRRSSVWFREVCESDRPSEFALWFKDFQTGKLTSDSSLLFTISQQFTELPVACTLTWHLSMIHKYFLFKTT